MSNRAAKKAKQTMKALGLDDLPTREEWRVAKARSAQGQCPRHGKRVCGCEAGRRDNGGRAMKTHMIWKGQVARCGYWTWAGSLSTHDPAKVTCKMCRRLLPKRASRRSPKGGAHGE